MFTITGTYTSASVFTDTAEAAAAAQIRELCDQPFAAGARICIMPDVHAGAGCVIGTTMTVTDKVVPNLVGVDIGCGMETTTLKETRFEPQKLDKLIRAQIPSGFAVRSTPHPAAEETDLTALHCYARIHERHALCSLGTLGGGNHFIELDRGEDGRLHLVIHSGSRHLGVEVARYYQEEAYRRLCRDGGRRQALADSLRAQGREQEIEAALRQLGHPDIPKHLAYCEGELLEHYLHDMAIVQDFAVQNRRIMTDVIVRGMHWHVEERFTTIHNYIDIPHGILRKGAVSAQAGERLLIPMNMRDGSLICCGRGNPDWNFSAPHGAGRLMSRVQAREQCSVAAYKQAMQGIYTTSVGTATIDECPMAYKPTEEILRHIGDTAEVVEIIRPVYNFKAGAEETPRPGKRTGMREVRR